MTTRQEGNESEPSLILRQWDRLPVAPRAVLSGLFVFVVLQIGWTVCLGVSIQSTPRVPWHVPVGLVYLWVVFRYFGGRWSPASTSSRRRESLGARPPSGREWGTALVASAAVMVFIITFAMLSYRVIVVPEDPTDLSMYPWWTVYSTLIMISVVAGVSEEAGFRGYMQRPLETRYGPVVAIGVSAIVFWLAHLNHPSGFARWPSLIVMGIALGALAFSARSILPGIMTHALADSVVFVGAQAAAGPGWLWSPPPLRETGLDGPFWGILIVVLAAGAVGALSLRRLRVLTGCRSLAPDGTAPATATGSARAG